MGSNSSSCPSSLSGSGSVSLMSEIHKNVQFNGVRAYIIEPNNAIKTLKYAIVLHGRNCNRKEITQFAQLQRFANLGYKILVPDFRGFGECNFPRSAKTINEDMKACFDYVTQLWSINTKQLLFIGHSLGGAMILNFFKFVSQELESDEFDVPKTILLLAPFTVLGDFVNKFLPSTSVFGNALNTVGKLTPILFEQNYDSYENIRYAKILDVRIFIVHGKQDELIPYSCAVKLAECGGDVVTLKISDNDDHNGVANRLWEHALNFNL